MLLNQIVHLNPLFNWNVKMLFLYMTAEYETDNNVSSKCVNILIKLYTTRLYLNRENRK